MKLRLKEIHLQNWKCYQNEKIKFALNTEGNIWIVFGKNGGGKTSFLEAITWCLYGSSVISRKNLLQYFNRTARKQNPELELSVFLKFIKNNDCYSITRTAKRVVRGSSESVEIQEASFYKNGQRKQNSREKIESILPRFCKEFFFFNGAKIEHYAQITHTEETREAIERILGIPELINLRDDAERALKLIEERLHQASLANKDLKKITDEIKEVQQKIELKREQIEKAKQELYKQSEILSSVKQEGNQIEELQGKFKEIERLKLEQINSESALKKAEQEVKKYLEQAPITLMLDYVREMVDDLQVKNIIATRKTVSIKLLQQLLENDTCVCGRCIDKDARQYIIEQLEESNISQNRTKQEIDRDNLRSNLTRLSKYETPDYDEILDEQDCISEKLDEIERAITRLKKETKGISQQKAKEIWRKVGQEENKYKQKQQDIERLQNDIDRLKHQENDLRRNREKLAVNDEETAMLNKQVKLAEGLYKAADELIDWHIEQCQRTIEEHTSKIHHQITNKPEEYKRIKINDNYTLRVKNSVGDLLIPTTLSTGEKEILAFAFIAGLNLASETAAPLVMDTPVGNLDTIHQKNIINYLPEFPSQVILLATDRELPKDILDKLKPDIAQIHKIQREEEKDRSIIMEIEK
ncbi:MAG: AAA family ATPase [Prochloraceae cyanobacterium]